MVGRVERTKAGGGICVLGAGRCTRGCCMPRLIHMISAVINLNRAVGRHED